MEEQLAMITEKAKPKDPRTATLTMSEMTHGRSGMMIKTNRTQGTPTPGQGMAPPSSTHPPLHLHLHNNGLEAHGNQLAPMAILPANNGDIQLPLKPWEMPKNQEILIKMANPQFALSTLIDSPSWFFLYSGVLHVVYIKV